LNIFYQPLIPEGIHQLDEDESRHCIKVLRKRPGDVIRLTDGKGNFYDAVITLDNPKKCSFDVRQVFPEKQKPYNIHVAISPTKNQDRIEWFVEKAVEFGVDTISLMECKNSERSFLKTERLTKVAVSAMKQSVKATLPQISPTLSFKEIISQPFQGQRFIAFVDSSNPLHLQKAARADNNYLVLIGPEGDFSPEELSVAIDLGFEKISLGSSRLRTETAGLAACHILNLINS
jgi:16S rRNA (uracil1498-N3)-methyltransferase